MSEELKRTINIQIKMNQGEYRRAVELTEYYQIPMTDLIRWLIRNEWTAVWRENNGKGCEVPAEKYD